jgi:hypothetical protein
MSGYDTLLPAGLTFLAGPPKSGKGWLALTLALAVASGGNRDVLYIALEDPEWRIQSRVLTLLAGKPAPQRLCVALEDQHFLEHGGIDAIAAWLQAAGRPRLVVIDTVVYGASNPALHAGLRRLASAYSVTVFVVVRSAQRLDRLNDPAGTLFRSYGLVDGVDSIIAMQRDKGWQQVVLHMRVQDRLSRSFLYLLPVAPARAGVLQ